METVNQRHQRKTLFTLKALNLNMGGNEDEITREAKQLFDEKNPIENCSDYLQK